MFKEKFSEGIISAKQFNREDIEYIGLDSIIYTNNFTSPNIDRCKYNQFQAEIKAVVEIKAVLCHSNQLGTIYLGFARTCVERWVYLVEW